MHLADLPANIQVILKIAFYLLLLWYFVLVAGTIQFRLLKRKTVKMILEHAGRMPDANREHLPERLYEAIYPEWCNMVRRSAWFIPSKSELRPISATAENVQKRFGFSPQWVKECLHDRRPDLLVA